jgi:Rod binding domain-containing protein
MITPHIQKPSSFYSSNISAKEPKEVANQFEALFYRILFEEMRASEEEDPLLGSEDGKQIQAMFHDELSNQLGQSGKLGISDLVLEDMNKRTSSVGLLKS